MKFKECRYIHHTGPNPVNIENMIRDKSRKDGYAEICKPCAYIRKKKYMERVYSGDSSVQSIIKFNQSQSIQVKRKKIEKGIEALLYKSARSRSIRKGLEFDLSISDIIIPVCCPILDIPLSTDVFLVDGVKRGSVFPENYPTIDRIDSNKGYTKDNCHVISWKANRLKSNASIEDIRKLYEWSQKLQT